MSEHDHLKSCRVCHVPAEGWALEGFLFVKPVQAWCVDHCIAEFEEHALYYEGDNIPRYCRHCGFEESPEDHTQ